MKFLKNVLLVVVCASGFAVATSARASTRGSSNRAAYQVCYLASYPRSGNHWMRFLLEEAAGIATGSVKCDVNPQHRKSSFEWGGFAPDGGYEGTQRMPKPGDVVVLKTHFPEQKRSPFDRKNASDIVVRLLRFPFDSFYSSFYYMNKDNWRNKVWKDFVRKEAQKWVKYQQHWEKQPGVLTVYYEDLLSDPVTWLTKICDAYGMIVTQQDIARAVEKYPPVGGVGKHLDHFAKGEIEGLVDILGSQLIQYGYDKYLE